MENVTVLSLTDLSLDQFVLWHEAENKILALNYKLEDVTFSVETEEIAPDQAEILQAEYNIDKYDLIKEQLLLFKLHKEEDLQKLHRLDWLAAKMNIICEFQEFTPGSVIIIPDANTEQIKDLQKELEDTPKSNKNKRSEIQLRIARLSKHEFILLPVQQAIFATKARTDALRKQLPKLPESISKDREKQPEEYQKNLELYIQKVQSEIDKADLDLTQREAKELLSLNRNIKRWQAETELTVYTLADKFLTHLLIPVDEEYSSKYAEARLPYIKKLTMDKVMPMVNFFLQVLKS